MEGGMPTVESSHVYALNASHTDNGIQIGLLGGSMVRAPNAHCFSLTTKYLNSGMILKDRFRIEVKARLEFEEEISFVIDYCLGVNSGQIKGLFLKLFVQFKEWTVQRRDLVKGATTV